MKLSDLVSALDNKLCLSQFPRDVSNNGLQLEGKQEVNLAGFAVDFSLETIQKAIAGNCDFLFVHHGMSWGSEPRVLTGSVARKIKLLFENNLSLYAAHLPLDAHPEIGNNAQLVEMFGLKNPVPCCEYAGSLIGFAAENSASWSVADFMAAGQQKLNAPAKIFGNAQMIPQRITVISGGGGMDALQSAVENGSELLITGEMEHIMYHPALENNLTVLALGHYASEQTGPLAVMRWVKDQFGINTMYIDVPTGL